MSMTTRTATARYDGFGKDGKGHLTTQSGVLTDQPYGFGTRFGDEPGTNPEELAAAAHAGCFTMALSFALATAGHRAGQLETKAAVTLDKDGAGFRITRSALTLSARVDGIEESEFARIAAEAKANCPISKLFDTEITLEHTLKA
jgi:osmotically inducible protein OsmC